MRRCRPRAALLLVLPLARAASLVPSTPRAPRATAPLRCDRRHVSELLAGAFLLTPAAACAKELYATDGNVLSGGDGRLRESVDMPTFGEDGSLIDSKDIALESSTRAVRVGATSVLLPSNWVQGEGGSLRDPVTGSTASAVRIGSVPTELAAISELGRPEQLDLVGALGLERALARADLVAAATRRGADGVTFYDFDLALPATSCANELATACLPTLVVLISAAVRGGKLHVLRVDAAPDQWRRAGQALRTMRSSFAVAEPEVAPALE